MKKIRWTLIVFSLTSIDWTFGLIGVALAIGSYALDTLLEAEERDLRRINEHFAESEAIIEEINWNKRDKRFRAFMEDDRI